MVTQRSLSKCHSSPTPFFFLIKNGSSSILRISVTEQGDPGFDVDKRITLINALYEALGPIALEELGMRLDEALL